MGGSGEEDLQLDRPALDNGARRGEGSIFIRLIKAFSLMSPTQIQTQGTTGAIPEPCPQPRLCMYINHQYSRTSFICTYIGP